MSRPSRILFLGCGSVTQAVLPLLLRDVKVPASSITILDFVDNRHRIAAELQAGVTYKELKITPENLMRLGVAQTRDPDAIEAFGRMQGGGGTAPAAGSSVDAERSRAKAAIAAGAPEAAVKARFKEKTGQEL
jgi:hypothetical protein